jgi:outer membrane protein assembly factor BamD
MRASTSNALRTATRLARTLWRAAPLALAFAAGCTDVTIGPGRKVALTYTDDAHAAYEEAMRSYRSKSWEDARVLLAEVKKLFPYSRYAALAELRIADVDFEQEKYTEAASGYREFIQNHRTDRDVEYARYRIAKSLYRDIDDTLFLPPQEERDQATALEAYKELSVFERENPKSRYADDVHKMLDAVRGRLMRHELYVARFYLREDRFAASIARIDHAIKLYPGSALEPEALVLKGETLLKMNKPAEARAIFQNVIDAYGGPFAVTARRYIAEIDAQKRASKGS